MFAFFMPGFLFGILYVNLTAQNTFTSPGIFSESFLRQYEAAEVAAGIYLLYLIRDVDWIVVHPREEVLGGRVPCVDGLVMRNHFVHGGDGDGNQGDFLLRRRGVAAVFALHTFLRRGALVLLDLPTEQVEPGKDGVRGGHDAGRHPLGSLCESDAG